MAIKGFSKVNDYITMLGTGNALATRCYNTCFTLHGENGVLLVNAGGGNGILTQLEKAGIRCEDNTDYILTKAENFEKAVKTLEAKGYKIC